MLWSGDGTGQGISVHRDESAAEQVVEAAGHVQEWAIEELWRRGARTNWPPCPLHPTTHPLQPVVRGSVAAWECPADGTAVAAIGDL